MFVSIPSSSGHQFTGRREGVSNGLHVVRFQSLLHQGISLLTASRPGVGLLSVAFQSLLHQGISLLANGCQPPIGMRKTFQSLLHQGISLLDDGGQPVKADFSVSIPSSSGHQFTGTRWVRSTGSGLSAFQSLLHQGISLLIKNRSSTGSPSIIGFNPFFIRASVYWLRLEISLEAMPAFQSLLHQGISLLANICMPHFKCPPNCVSIPSSSGHQFTGRIFHSAEKNSWIQFQSLLHQGISLL